MRRPLLYMVAAAISIAMAVPLAVSSGQMKTGGMFDECFEASCDGLAMTASAE